MNLSYTGYKMLYFHILFCTYYTYGFIMCNCLSLFVVHHTTKFLLVLFINCNHISFLCSFNLFIYNSKPVFVLLWFHLFFIRKEKYDPMVRIRFILWSNGHKTLLIWMKMSSMFLAILLLTVIYFKQCNFLIATIILFHH